MTISTVSKRKPDAELPFDRPSSTAYDRFSHSVFFRAERLLFVRELRKYQPSGSLLDIGCGPGYLLKSVSKHYPALSLFGLDISEDMVELAKRNLPADTRLMLADAASIPLTEGSIDTVVSSGSLHHWKVAPAVFDEILRVLVPGGRFLILDLRRDVPRALRLAAWIANRFVPEELQRTRGVTGSLESAYTPGELEEMLSSIHFKELQVSTGPAWVLATARKSDS